LFGFELAKHLEAWAKFAGTKTQFTHKLSTKNLIQVHAPFYQYVLFGHYLLTPSKAFQGFLLCI
jgi:hypothetical protein